MDTIFYIFCTTLPSHILAFTVFWDFQWRSKKAAFFLAAMNVLLKMSAASFFVSHQIYYRSLEFLFSVIGFLIYCIFIRMNFFKLAFTFIIIIDYLIIIRGLASFCAAGLFHFQTQSWQSNIMVLQISSGKTACFLPLYF